MKIFLATCVVSYHKFSWIANVFLLFSILSIDNFYFSAVDAQLKKDTDNPNIGLLLCKNKNNLVAEYSLKDMSKPMGISEYKISSVLPEELSQ